MAKDEEGKVFFDQDEQAELDRIISERISRVKKEVPEDYNDLKSIAENLEVLGYSGTPSEIKEAIESYVSEWTAQNTQEEIVEEIADSGELPSDSVLKALAKQFGTTPERLERTLKKQIQEEDAKEEQEKRSADADRQMKEFGEKYPDVDIVSLSENAKFIKFVKTHQGDLTQQYEDFIDLMGDVESETIQKVKSSMSRTTGGGSTASASGNYGLTPDQLKTLEDWNRKNPKMQMTPKEFKKYSE